MFNESDVLKGTVRGKTIELDHEPGLPDGQTVSVVLHPTLPPGEGLRRAFGAWAQESEELDRFLEEIRRDRKQDRNELGA
ncbi:MAG: hypothetical protein JWP03_2249 [Phycisphaerales bacterium]|jgi:hypothetical protein|nr:hypothetical protein [Phycisphaerales bacterium]